MMAFSGDVDNSESGILTFQTDPQQHTLPRLVSTPKPYPGCCLALSTPLVAYLCTLLPYRPHLILSIGSGYGLLEALLLSPPYSLNVIGIEVQPSPNIYLHSSNHKEVIGSRSLHELAAETEAWMFVYPRRVGIVEEYLKTYGDGRVQCVLWLGPRADWEDYKSVFGKQWAVEVKAADEVGGRAWELIAVARKKP
jgi:hypothetical protein